MIKQQISGTLFWDKSDVTNGSAVNGYDGMI